ncbi:Protein of unknown function [Micromonospora phaseoli]|uniref:LppM domain-containing protein n=2 Tax=Micromonospora phaseoli TaxID=1144548 RepID=A0A1H6YU13_9ACTN|nr:uncharacterized protein DUF3153 [Micromonospora phaseoli]GIJ76898.1 hypothetical protein Xph01_13300 [Micromonospora phaseoli]SEJ44758.1 Protein of unknown function [Micromonospora phaseoli]
MNTGFGRIRALRGAVCLALVAALSGCMQFNAGLTVNADDTVSGQLLLTAARNVLTANNRPVETGFAELRQNIPALPAGPETKYEDATHFGSLINYRNVPLDQFDSESLSIVRDGDRYVFTLPLDPKRYGGKVAEQDPENQARFMLLMSFEIAVTFPGRVLDASTGGQVNDRTVTWRVKPNEQKPVELRAVAEAPPRPSAAAGADTGGGFPWLLVVGGTVALLLVAVLVVLLLRRPRTSTAGDPAPDSASAQGGRPTPATPAGGTTPATTNPGPPGVG